MRLLWYRKEMLFVIGEEGGEGMAGYTVLDCDGENPAMHK